MIRLRRFILNTVVALSLSLAVLTAINWARGGWVDQGFHKIGGNWYYGSDGGTYKGLIQLGISHYFPSPIVGPSTQSSWPTVVAWKDKPFEFHIENSSFALRYWVELGTNAAGQYTMVARRLDFAAPFGAVITALLVLPAFMWLLLPLRRHLLRSAPLRAAQIADPRAIIGADLACVHCGYNLRTLTSGGQCPECGSAIADSLRTGSDLSKSRVGWLRSVAAGNLLLFLSRGFLAVTFGFIFQSSGLITDYVPAAWCAGIQIVLYGVGMFLLTAREHRHVHAPKRRRAVRLRWLAAVSLLSLTAGLAWQVLETINARVPFGMLGPGTVNWEWVTLIVMLLGWVLLSACVRFEFLYHAKLSEGLPGPLISRVNAWTGAIAAISGLAMLYGVRELVTQNEPLGILGFVVAVWLASLLACALINLDAAVRWRQIARLHCVTSD